MPSKLREAALRHDLDATLWRIGFTQDNKEIPDLLPEQLRNMAKHYPEDSGQFHQLCKLITYKESIIP